MIDCHMFLVPFLIMLREGLEAALIVSIIASYLKKTGNEQWMRFVWFGIVSAVVLCCIVGLIMVKTLGEISQREQELFEGIVAIIAVFVLTYMVFWMNKAAKSIKNSLTNSIDVAMNRSKGQGIMLVGMAFFAVAREGLESLFFLFAIFEQDTAKISAPLGAFSGLLLAVLLGLGIYHGSVRLNLAKFFRFTSIFILFVAAGLAASALKALHEAGIWNALQTIVYDASVGPFSTHGFLGTILAGLFGYSDSPTQGEVIVYFTYLIPALLFFFWPKKTLLSEEKKESTV
ncbi:iron uptake transporter permease EfeU [Neisseria sp. Ec49-e6-T10]|uniref:iron uptake transporter permease EfeU n=1 Tax=Neisseria sp. Ec49-e6-T10 TaxID=3140744 RepID=UPI003EC0F4FC